MVIIDLTPGQHTIMMSMSGYINLNAIINISTEGTVTCISVTNGSCNSDTPPGIVVSGATIVGYLLESLETICSWITNKGGWENLITYDIMALIRGYSGEESLGFNVVSADIMGAIAYYSGNRVSGNALTGCNF